jgi:hypothetical protein
MVHDSLFIMMRRRLVMFGGLLVVFRYLFRH